MSQLYILHSRSARSFGKRTVVGFEFELPACPRQGDLIEDEEGGRHVVDHCLFTPNDLTVQIHATAVPEPGTEGLL